MYTRYLKLFLFLFLLGTTSCSLVKQTPQTVQLHTLKREFRGAWIQTVFQSEYKNMSPAQMQKDFVRKLNILQTCGINAVIFQVRPEGDAWYPSKLEPWSRFLTGEQGLAPDPMWDPMAFLIKECHKRNMEFHAWLNPYRISTSGTTVFAPNHIYNHHPEWFVTYNKMILFDPGLPQSRDFICKVVKDIVSRYDVDAIHMDDYFYPYPVAGLSFPDDKSFEMYGLAKGYKESQRNDWRRENVNSLIKDIKRTIVLTKPWVRFGISPFGIYRNKRNTPDGSGSETNGLQCYDDLYADVLRWVKEGWIDYNMPQIYWEIGNTAADYITLAKWWDQNAGGIPLYLGQDVARTMKKDQLDKKINYERKLPNVKGNCFWPANEILWNTDGVADQLYDTYHHFPALIPSYTHMCDRAPKAVSGLKAEWTEKGYLLQWKAKQDSINPELARYFVVYRFGEKDHVDLENPSKIIAITPETSYMLPYKKGNQKYRYVVTAVDRFHNESKGKAKKVKL